MNDVIRFINVFTSSNKNKEVVEIFTNQCSYWFASILFRRFIKEGATIMYDRTKQHFGTQINGMVYDATGDVTSKYKWDVWLDIDADTKESIMGKKIMF